MKIFSVAFVALLLATTSSAATNTLPLRTPCEITDSKVVPGFRGHDTDAVVGKLKRVVTPKDEYESEQAFAERLNRVLKSSPLAISEGSLCVVDQNLGLGNTEYDPESETLWVYIFLKHEKSWFDGKNIHNDFQIYVSERKRKDSSYTGSNAFGASVQVSKVERSATYVSFDRQETTSVLESAGAVYKDDYLALPLNIPAKKAKALQGAVRVAYRYKLRPPLLGSYQSFELPKLNWPFEREENQTLVAASLTGIIVFDNKNGDVLRSIDLVKVESQ